jgi:hypothetical protein
LPAAETRENVNPVKKIAGLLGSVMSNSGNTVETMNFRIVPSVVALAVLAGCEDGAQCFSGACENVPGGPVGGGGGLMTIDENNALPALREAWYAATVTAAVPAIVVATGIGDTSGGVAKGGPIVSKSGSSGRVYVDPFGPTTYNCPVSGTFTVSGDVTDPNTVTLPPASTSRRRRRVSATSAPLRVRW